MHISKILKSNNVCLSNIPSLIVKKCYNFIAFNSISYTLSNDFWSLKTEPSSCPIDEPADDNSPRELVPPTLPKLKMVEELNIKIPSMDVKFNNL